MEDNTNIKKSLGIEDGMLLDVIMPNDQVLFSGCVDGFDGNSLYLLSPDGDSIPSLTFGTELKLRGQFPSGDEVKVFHGTVIGSRSNKCKIGELCDWYGWNRRSFFRQDLSIEARVLRTKRVHARSMLDLDMKVSCRLLDVSGGGVRLACSRAVFEVGDQLHITDATLLPGEPPFSFYCVVKRIEKARFNNIYGCQFFGLSTREEDRLVNAVFKLQLQERRKSIGSF